MAYGGRQLSNPQFRPVRTAVQIFSSASKHDFVQLSEWSGVRIGGLGAIFFFSMSASTETCCETIHTQPTHVTWSRVVYRWPDQRTSKGHSFTNEGHAPNPVLHPRSTSINTNGPELSDTSIRTTLPSPPSIPEPYKSATRRSRETVLRNIQPSPTLKNASQTRKCRLARLHLKGTEAPAAFNPSSTLEVWTRSRASSKS
mmetsp:Transcript_11236/g.28409  ORF Transcript_11236/g.28409 Transcript_11236/m.28409 type:complete len:200 (+) Transcript_11236:456-1055(+)